VWPSCGTGTCCQQQCEGFRSISFPWVPAAASSSCPLSSSTHSHSSCCYSWSGLGSELAGSDPRARRGNGRRLGRWVANREGHRALQRRDPVRNCPAHRIRSFLQALVAAPAAARSACRRSTWRSRSRRPRRRPSSRPLVSPLAPALFSLVLCVHVGRRTCVSVWFGCHLPAIVVVAQLSHTRPLFPLAGDEPSSSPLLRFCLVLAGTF
jgi:hypothetical protein